MSTYEPRMTGTTKRPPWNDDDDEKLVTLFHGGDRLLAISVAMARSIGTIRAKLGLLRKAGRVGNRNPNRWKRLRYYVKRTHGQCPWRVFDRDQPQHKVRTFSHREQADAFAAFLNKASCDTADLEAHHKFVHTGDSEP